MLSAFSTYSLTSSLTCQPASIHSFTFSGPTTKKLTPPIVSSLVVNTSNFSTGSPPLTSKATLTPSFFPIHCLCAVFIFSGQSIFSILANSFSAYSVILKCHELTSFLTTSVLHRSHTPPSTCSSDTTVLHEGHQLTHDSFL